MSTYSDWQQLDDVLLARRNDLHQLLADLLACGLVMPLRSNDVVPALS
jgi:hypothetical protein